MNLDWRTGTWTAADLPAGNVRVMVTGDWIPFRGYRETILRDSEVVYGDLLPLLRGADLKIVNLECALTDGVGVPLVKSGPNLCGPTEAVAALKVVPFDLACLANNHVMDYGATGLESTLETLREAGVRSVGAGRTREEALAPAFLTAGGCTLGIINFCEGEDVTAAKVEPGVFGWELEEVAQVMREVRQKVDVVMVIFHGGREHVPVPPPYVVRALRFLADSGADIVVAHHPHVPQGIEIYNGKPIIYSLGNFVFDQNTEAFYRRAGYMVEITLGSMGVSGFKLHPYVLGPEHLSQMPEPRRGQFLKRLEEVSVWISDPEKLTEAWDAVVGKYAPALLKGMANQASQALEGTQPLPTLRNTLHTPAHREVLLRALSLYCAGKELQDNAGAKALLDEWLTLKETK